LAPLFGGADVDEVTGTDSGTHITQSETYTLANPDNPNQVVTTFNDSRTAGSCYAGGSFSTDGGATFTRLTPSPSAVDTGRNFGDPVTLYNKPTGTFFAIFLATGCGGQGIGSWKSVDGGVTWVAGPCIHNGGSDDRESGWSDNNPVSPFFGRMYVSWNDFAVGGNLKIRFSSDNGNTWNERQLAGASPFIRDVQITGDQNGNRLRRRAWMRAAAVFLTPIKSHLQIHRRWKLLDGHLHRPRLRWTGRWSIRLLCLHV
jgi:hypothetical protein